MELIMVNAHRFKRSPDGTVWAQTMFPYSFWTRYLEVFPRVHILSRLEEVDYTPSGWLQASGEGLNFIALPYYEGPWQFLSRYWRIAAVTKRTLAHPAAVILRVPSTISTIVEMHCRKSARPYGVEVVGDPYDVFSPGAIRHPLRPFFRWFSQWSLKRQCRNAIAASYVTAMALQRRYPCPNFSIGVSDVDLTNNSFISQPRHYRLPKTITIIIVGSLNHFYKSQDVLIDAVGQCAREGLDVKLVIVGGGKYLEELKARAASQDLANRCIFTGQLTCGDEVIKQLDQADLFVLPSRQEGLPRAMLEAMARGLPCIGSTVGGIPELLAPEDLVPPNDVGALALKIKEVISDPRRLEAMSARNLAKAYEYRNEATREKRITFYRFVKDRTESWLLQCKRQ